MNTRHFLDSLCFHNTYFLLLLFWCSDCHNSAGECAPTLTALSMWQASQCFWSHSCCMATRCFGPTLGFVLSHDTTLACLRGVLVHLVETMKGVCTGGHLGTRITGGRKRSACCWAGFHSDISGKYCFCLNSMSLHSCFPNLFNCIALQYRVLLATKNIIMLICSNTGNFYIMTFHPVP